MRRVPSGFSGAKARKLAIKPVKKIRRPDLKNKPLTSAHKMAIKRGLAKFHRTGKAATFSFADARGRTHTVKRVKTAPHRVRIARTK